MKRHELIFSTLKVPLDFLIMWGAFFIAREIRLISDLIPGVVLPIQTLSSEVLNHYALAGALLYICIFASHKLYSLQIFHSKIQEILDIIRYGIYWFMFFAVGVYLWNGIIFDSPEIPRLIILFSALLSIVWSIFIRIFLNALQSWLLTKGSIEKRNLLLLSGLKKSSLEPILDDIQEARIYQLLGYANPEKIKASSCNYLWGIPEIKKMLAKHRVDEILVLENDFTQKQLKKIWELCRIYGVRYRYVTHHFDISQSHTNLWFISKTPVIEIQNTPLDNWGRIWKRSMDLLLSSVFLILISPLLALIALLIKLEDPSGPVIYKNLRIGQHGKIFHCYKFRYLQWKYCTKESYGSSNEDDPAIIYEKELIASQNSRSGPLYKIKNDPRKTRIGAFLEKYSLDEIPQFWNVIRGDMSIVGPRPHQPREVSKYQVYQNRLLTIKPGITGMAQVNGREENNFEKEAELDIFYIENWSFLLDIKIMFKTLSIILTRK